MATLDPADLTAGVVSLESVYPEGTAYLLRVDLSSRPNDLEDQMIQLNQELLSLGAIPVGSTPICCADPVEPTVYISWTNTGVNPMDDGGLVSTSVWGGLLPIILFVVGFALFPIVSDLLMMVMNIVVMMLMMYMMISVMSQMYPEEESIQKIKTWRDDLVIKARAGVPSATAKLKAYADKGEAWAEKAWDKYVVPRLSKAPRRSTYTQEQFSYYH